MYYDLLFFTNLISQILKCHTPQCYDLTLLSEFVFICKHDIKTVVLMRDMRLYGDISIRCNIVRSEFILFVYTIIISDVLSKFINCRYMYNIL